MTRKTELLSFRRAPSIFGAVYEVGEPTWSNGGAPVTLVEAARLAVAHLTGEDLGLTTGEVIAALNAAVEAHGT